MVNWHSSKTLIEHIITIRTLRACDPLPKPQSFSTTTISDPQSFTVSYLITNCGFSAESAVKFSRTIRFDSPTKPDSVLSFFTAHGFSPSQIRAILKRQRRILLCDPTKVLLPKFDFLRSKGASTADIVHMVTTSPRFLYRSLDNHIVPAYHFLRSFLNSDQQILSCLNRNSSFLSDGRLLLNSQLLLHNGVKHSGIAKLLRMWPSILCSCNLSDTLLELKQLGFDSSTTTFTVALLAKRTVNKTKWGEKVEAFKKWGWSDDDVIFAFRRQPYCMMTSPEKIDAVFSFWVGDYGGHALELVKFPIMFQLSLQKRMLPRAAVLRFLGKNGLRKKGASMVTPFLMTEQVFLDKFVKCFEKHSSRLLKIYEESMNVVGNN